MAELELQIGTTYLKTTIESYHPLYRPLADYLRHRATVWRKDIRQQRWFIDGEVYTYDPLSHRLRVPIGYLDPIVALAEEHHVSIQLVERPPIIPATTSLSLRPTIEPRDYQLPYIEFFVNRQGKARRALELQTGKGKTFITIAALCRLQQVAMVICSGLTEQWVREFTQFTVDPNLYVIQTRQSIERLLADVNLRPSVFICSLATLRLFALGLNDYRTLGVSYPEFQARYGIGIKIVDETHLNVVSISNIELFSDITDNWYLSATFHRSGWEMRRIFEQVYPNSILYHAGTYDRYVSLYYYRFRSGVSVKKTMTQRGYSHAKFEYQLFRTPKRFAYWATEVVGKRLVPHFLNIRNDGERALILVTLIATAKALVESLTKQFPQLTIVTVIQNDKDTKFQEGDVIVSVPAKSGTGRDIPHLRTVINTISTGSPELIEQIMGRLRRLRDEGKNDITPEFVQLYDCTHPTHLNYNRTHREVCLPRVATWAEDEV